MDEHFKKCETDFVMMNYECLFFRKSYTNSSLINFCGRSGIRVDRVIQAEVINATDLINKCLSVSYSYHFTHKNEDHSSSYLTNTSNID